MCPDRRPDAAAPAPQRLQRGRQIDAACVHVDALQVRMRGQQAVERGGGGIGLPGRGNLQHLQRREILHATAESLGPITAVDRCQVAHDLHHLARLHLRAQVLAGPRAIGAVVGTHHHRHLAPGRRHVHRHHRNLPLLGQGERSTNGRRIQWRHHQPLGAEVDQIGHVGDLLGRVLVGVHRRQDVDPKGLGHLREVAVVGLPERRGQQWQVDPDPALRRARFRR